MSSVEEEPLLDWDFGLSIVGGNKAVLLMFLTQFKTAAAETMGKIEKLYEAKDMVSFRRESHSLKGSSSYVGLKRLSKTAHSVQLCVDEKREEMIPDQLKVLQTVYTDTMAAIDQRIEQEK